jgi:hypothetical protein
MPGTKTKTTKATFVAPKKPYTRKRRGAPSNANRKSKRPPASEKGLIAVVGGKGVDLSSEATTSYEGKRDQLKVVSTEEEMVVNATINVRSLANLSMGAVLLALKRGWSAGIKNGENPYYAFQYMYNVFLTALTVAAPINTGAPVWMWELLASLKPKDGSFKTGKVSYNWVQTSTSFPPAPVFTYIASPTSAICWGTPDGVLTVLGYPVVDPADAALYTDALGSASFISMCKFMPTGPMNVVVGGMPTPMMEKDTSAFAISYPELGNSLDTTGALAQTIYSEREIASPILAKFALYQPVGENYRGWHRAGKSAGSPTYIIPRMAEFTDVREVRDKLSPIYAFYNFDEFFYALSIALGGAIEKSDQGDGQVATVCPLSSQVVQYLLRQTIIGIFGNHLAQDIYLSSTSTNLFTMVPFSVGPNGVSFTESKMLLPTVLTENIRCCQRKIKQIRNRAGQTNVFDIVSILARPPQLPMLGNFSTANTNVPLVYSVNTLEVDTNIIDCSYVTPNGVQYFSPTGALIADQYAIWNSWITSLAGTLSPLVSVSTEAGISALMASVYTRGQVNNQDTLKARLAEKDEEKKEEEREKEREKRKNDPASRNSSIVPYSNSPLPKKKAVPELSREQQLINMYRKKVTVEPEEPTYLNTNIEKETISNQPPMAPCWKFISLFILPIFLSEAQDTEASVQTWQTFQIQPYLISGDTIAGGEGNLGANFFPSIASRLSKLAVLDTKALNQQQNNEMVTELVEAGKQGRGGFFADVAGVLSGVFLPGSGEAVRSIATSIGL